MTWLSRFYYGVLGVWFGAFVAEILAAISAFSMARHVQASPGIAPYNDPAFQEYSAKIVGGFIANKTFNLLHAVELICFVILMISLILLVLKKEKLKKLPIILIVFAGMAVATTYFWITPEMGALKDTMYTPGIEEAIRATARINFDWYHKLTEKLISLAGLAILITLNISNTQKKENNA